MIQEWCVRTVHATGRRNSPMKKLAMLLQYDLAGKGTWSPRGNAVDHWKFLGPDWWSIHALWTWGPGEGDPSQPVERDTGPKNYNSNKRKGESRKRGPVALC